MSLTEQEILPKSNRLPDLRSLLFLLAAAIYLYGFLFVPPFIPIGINGDGLVYLGDAQRMWHGEVMYRDFFQFTTPGTAMVYLSLFKIFGLRSWIPNFALLVVGVALAGLGVVIAKKVVRPGLVLLPSTIFLVCVYRNLLDGTHHWYSLLAATAAIIVLVDCRTHARIAAAGFFCGLAFCFTQTRGLAMVVGLAVFLWWESQHKGETGRKLFKSQVWLLAGFLATTVGINSYFVWKAGLRRFLWCTVVFGLKYHPQQMDENSFHALSNDLPRLAWQSSVFFRLAGWLLIDVIVPIVPILFFVHYWRVSKIKPRENWERPMLLAIACFAMVLSVAPAPASIRTASCTLPGIVLLVWFLDSPRKVYRTIVAVASAGIFALLPHAVARVQSVRREIFTTRRGQLAVADPDSQEQYSWVLQHTRASDYLYEMGSPYLYFYLDLSNPTSLPLLTNCGYTPQEQVGEAIRGLEQHRVRYVMWSPEWAEARADWESPADNHLAPLRNFMREHYRRVTAFQNSEEVWERSDSALSNGQQ